MADPLLLQSGHGFRMQLCKGRGAGAGADVDPLAPAAGAPHSDVFRVTTLASDSAWGRPVMGIPTGRHQKLNPSSRTTDKGRLTVRLLDEALDPADNSVRWVTAFLNTADGKDQLAGLKAILWETHDDGLTWDYYFTGRVSADDWESGTTVYRIDLNDLSGDLEFDIFVGVPHPDANGGVGYAYPQPCLPLGIPFDYLGLAPVGPMRGLAQVVDGRRVLTTDSKFSRLRRASVSEAFKALADDIEITTPLFDFLPEVGLAFNGDQCHVYLYREADPATEYGPYPLRAVGLWGPSDATDQHYRAKRVYAEGFTDGLVAGAAGAAHPALSLGEWYGYRVVRHGAVSEAFPMLVGQRQGIHPVQYFKDICRGYFSRRDPATGAPAYSMAIDEAAFDALIADTTFVYIHDKPTKVWPAIDYIEDVICQTASLGWRLDGQGRVVPIDLRLESAVVAFALTEDDLTDSPDAFGQGGEERDAITAVNATYYVDQQLSLDAEKGTGVWTTVPSTYLETHEVPLEFADFTPKARDIGDRPIDWDAQGIRLGVLRSGQISNGAFILTNAGKRAAVVARMLQAIAERRRPFRSKPNTYRFEVDRTPGVEAIAIGQYGTVQAERLVDPDTNTRGGTRLGLCLGVEVIDATTAAVDVLDVGPVDLVDPENPVPAATDPPVLDNYAVHPTFTTNVEVDGTLNAAGDAIVFRVAETGTDVLAVGDVPDDAWYPFGNITNSRNVVFGPVAGPRVWLQGRSEPGLGTTSGNSLPPSAWVSPLNAEYVDLDTLDPPTGPAVSNVDQQGATFTWTPAAEGFPLEVWYGAGTLTGATLLTSGTKVAFLPPGSVDVALGGLAGPNAAVTLGVRHVDPASGRVSAFALVNFNTAADGTLVAPRMAGIGLLGDA